MAFCLQPGFRVAVLVGIGLAIFQQITGINTIIYYTPTILQMSGYPSAKAAILAVGDHRGGQRPDYAGFHGAGRSPGPAVPASAEHGGDGHVPGVDRRRISPEGFERRGVLRSVAYIVSFGIGLGPVMWLLISEIYPTKIRGKAMSLATLSVWGSNWMVAVTFLSLLHHAGPAKTFWLYACICVAAFIFCCAFVPETNGRSLEAIEHHWRRSGRKDHSGALSRVVKSLSGLR